MVDVDPEWDGDAEDETDGEGHMNSDSLQKRTTTIILSHPWVKVAYDENGQKITHPQSYLSKARVSCMR